MATRVADDGTVLESGRLPGSRRPGRAILHTAGGACSEGGVCLLVAGADPGFIGPIGAVPGRGQ